LPCRRQANFDGIEVNPKHEKVTSLGLPRFARNDGQRGKRNDESGRIK